MITFKLVNLLNDPVIRLFLGVKLRYGIDEQGFGISDEAMAATVRTLKVLNQTC
jgi:hypothetical protein